MIKKILDWILGKNSSGTQTQGMADTMQPVAPYKVETPVETTPVKEVTDTTVVTVVEAPVVETPAVTVKAKYKKAELNKMTKKELLDLAAQHGVAVKARSAKADLVKSLSKV